MSALLKVYDHRRKTFPIRTGLAAISLFTLGSILIYVSTLIGLDEERRGLSFLILGLIGAFCSPLALTFNVLIVALRSVHPWQLRQRAALRQLQGLEGLRLQPDPVLRRLRSVCVLVYY